ncbi:unnamed protein product (macronuclear) [Paramecium tetraurelia]|uniref:Cystatin domain-containing protein n=1 Tax=Paramecium tetraurelia TaxID=5888 RepID=A0D6I6_PARTE|nr:uncharacterized protein GSPATT00001694001 [Paramecium tetraurelia]CAK78653.1 unnamed protein product [Paramecium tetraurelia]|eukprot:XP_001446050.1 hypothetical protein (macronuclear) [Paramecium tetraurelia strain d4-2]
MKFIIFNILVYFVVSEVETVFEDGIEWTKMPIEFEEVEQPIENLQGGEGTTNYGKVDYGITEEMAKMFKTLNDPHYDVITRPIIKEIGLDFFESHYKSFCNTEQFFERLIYQGSNVEFNTINMIYHVKMTVNEFMVEFSLKNWDSEKNDFQIKEFTKCEIYIREQKKQDL